MAPSKSDNVNKAGDGNDGRTKFPKWSLSDVKDVKVDKWDGSAVKNALDDAVRKVFTEKFRYTENHRLMDGRLAICVLAVAVAVLALAWDSLYPFPQSRPILIISVVSYFVLMGVLTTYTTYTEKGIFLVAVKKETTKAGSAGGAGVSEQVWHVSSDMKRFDDVYHLVLSYSSSNGKIGHGASNRRETKLEKSVCSWFDENGVLLFGTFEEDVSRLHNGLLADKKDK